MATYTSEDIMKYDNLKIDGNKVTFMMTEEGKIANGEIIKGHNVEYVKIDSEFYGFGEGHDLVKLKDLDLATATMLYKTSQIPTPEPLEKRVQGTQGVPGNAAQASSGNGGRVPADPHEKVLDLDDITVENYDTQAKPDASAPVDAYNEKFIELFYFGSGDKPLYIVNPYVIAQNEGLEDLTNYENREVPRLLKIVRDLKDAKIPNKTGNYEGTVNAIFNNCRIKLRYKTNQLIVEQSESGVIKKGDRYEADKDGKTIALVKTAGGYSPNKVNPGFIKPAAVLDDTSSAENEGPVIGDTSKVPTEPGDKLGGASNSGNGNPPSNYTKAEKRWSIAKIVGAAALAGALLLGGGIAGYYLRGDRVVEVPGKETVKIVETTCEPCPDLDAYFPNSGASAYFGVEGLMSEPKKPQKTRIARPKKAPEPVKQEVDADAGLKRKIKKIVTNPKLRSHADAEALERIVMSGDYGNAREAVSDYEESIKNNPDPNVLRIYNRAIGQ